jgi:hypothetical protein
MICPECNSDLVLCNIPKAFFDFVIPFTHKRFSILLWDWNNKEPTCLECAASRKARYEESIFNAGFERGSSEEALNIRRDDY